MSINALTQQMFDAERRRAERDDVFYRTFVRIVGQAPGMKAPMIPSDLVNISRSGFMVRTDSALAEGTRLTINLPVIGERPAKIVWALGGRIGAEFADQIEPVNYFTLLAALPRN